MTTPCGGCNCPEDAHVYDPGAHRRTCRTPGCDCYSYDRPADPIADVGLFEVEAPPPVTLADRFTMPPLSTLDRRGGEWQARKRAWMRYGIQSEVGRDAGLAFAKSGGTDPVSMKLREVSDGTSVFDPVLCELVYRWFSKPGATVLDPFAGGSVRGIVAGILRRQYTGLDIRMEQVAANTAQADVMSWEPASRPMWMVGDATAIDDTVPWDAEVDLVFSCPPYHDLEVYSDDPRDLSTWTYDEFLVGHGKAIRDACDHLREDRYAAWVIGDVRDKRTGTYRGLHHATVDAFEAAGLRVLNECVMVDPVFGAAIRAGRPMAANRKITLTHQHLYVFVKGDVRRAADWAGEL